MQKEGNLWKIFLLKLCPQLELTNIYSQKTYIPNSAGTCESDTTFKHLTLSILIPAMNRAN